MLLLEPPSYIHLHQTTMWVLWQTAVRCVCLGSMVTAYQIAVIEYSGNFLMAGAQHGLSKKTGQEYV